MWQLRHRMECYPLKNKKKGILPTSLPLLDHCFRPERQDMLVAAAILAESTLLRFFASLHTLSWVSCLPFAELPALNILRTSPSVRFTTVIPPNSCHSMSVHTVCSKYLSPMYFGLYPQLYYPHCGLTAANPAFGVRVRIVLCTHTGRATKQKPLQQNWIFVGLNTPHYATGDWHCTNTFWILSTRRLIWTNQLINDL